MFIKRVYSEDLLIASSLLRHDEAVTRSFYYGKCYPLFKSVFDHYYTGCETCKEFMDEIYLLTLLPNKKTGRCQLQNYKGESTLTNWYKTVCLYYCYKAYRRKRRLSVISSEDFVSDDGSSDRLSFLDDSIEIELAHINQTDVETIINLMPNERYRDIIKIHYLEDNDNDESALLLDMSKANFYNKKILAREQFLTILKKEGRNE